MCPFCMIAGAMLIAGTASTGGLAAIIVKKFADSKSAAPSDDLTAQVSTRREPEVENEAPENR